MSELLLILLMALIGAIIGGVTNSLAIKMLFRPYEPIYIAGWKIPFTPGLIPKRRQELAKQLGRMVVEHLLTPEGIRRKLQQSAFQNQLKKYAQEEATRFLTKDISVQKQLQQFGIEVNEALLQKKVASWTEQYYEKYLMERRNQPLHDLLNKEWLNGIDKNIDSFTVLLQERLAGYLDSYDSKRKIANLIDTFLEGRGFFGGMVAQFIDRDGLVAKIQPLLVQYLHSDEAYKWINDLLKKEVNNLLAKPVAEIEDKIGREWAVSQLQQIVINLIPIEQVLNKRVCEISTSLLIYVDKIIPSIIGRVNESISNRMDQLLQRLQLEEIVEKEVETFPIERIEQLVLSISKKEFKLITYLGALLGGMIGIVQGIIVILIQ